MKECREFDLLMDRVQTAESSEEEREKLLDHLESCAACNDAFEALGRLRNDDLYPEPAAEEFLAARRNVIREIRNKKDRKSWGGFSLPSFHWRPVFAGICALAMLILGFFLGGGVMHEGTRSDKSRSIIGPDGLMQNIKYVAEGHAAYEDIVNSPFTYTNVRLAKENAGMVNLSFDVSRHLNLTLREEDPLLTEVLVQSLIEPSGVGTRLAAISMAGVVPDPKIKKSLIFAMLHDENLAVRITAQSKLVEHRGDAEIVDSLLTVLERERSVQMRLVAIDYLAGSNIQAERLKRAITSGKRDGSDAVFIRANQYLNR
jgi:hypothetical protein